MPHVYEEITNLLNKYNLPMTNAQKYSLIEAPTPHIYFH